MASLISKIYMWLMRDRVKEAINQMQNEPKLKKQKQQVDQAKAEFIEAAMKDDKFLELIAQSIHKLKKEKRTK